MQSQDRQAPNRRYFHSDRDGNELPQEGLTFQNGVQDGLPICLGYFSVSFAFGIAAMQAGLPAWGPILTSLTSFTGTGQFVGVNLMAAGTACFEIAFTVLIINMRYLLMSLSLSQKIPVSFTLLQRMVIAFGNTDEIYAVVMQQARPLTFSYMVGIILCSFTGWCAGTLLGTFASAALPISVRSALGIALYAMFIAIIIPPIKRSKPIRNVVMLSIIMSCGFHFLPLFDGLSSGWIIIICGIIASALGAYLYPMELPKEEG